nr:PTS glucose transporter subunit IIA [Limosilactobacillus mucosae]
MKGEHFESFVKQDQTVHAGDKLGSIDLEAVNQAGYDTTVMLVVTNSDYSAINYADEGSIQHGDQLLALQA